jgi:hypothetical protein
MKRVLQALVIYGIAAEALVIGQGADAAKVLAGVKAAVGADKVDVKTVLGSGRTSKVANDAAQPATDFDLAMELPDKYMRTDVIMSLGENQISRTTGFNGDGVIEVVDAPNMGDGRVFYRLTPGGPPPGVDPTPAQKVEQHKASLLSSHQEFARLTLGMFPQSFESYPLEFAYGGQGDTPSGKADILTVKGKDDFAARLYVDAASHLPVMLSWMAKEQQARTVVNSGGGNVVSSFGGSASASASAGGGGSVTLGGGTTLTPGSAAGSTPMTPEERDKMMKDLAERAKQAEAARPIVEYRLYYGDFKDVSGVKLPHHFVRAMAGKTIEESVFDKLKVNAKIDPKKFQVSK